MSSRERRYLRRFWAQLFVLLLVGFASSTVQLPAAHADWKKLRTDAYTTGVALARAGSVMVACQIVKKLGKEACGGVSEVDRQVDASLRYTSDMGDIGNITVEVNNDRQYGVQFFNGFTKLEVCKCQEGETTWSASTRSAIAGLADMAVCVDSARKFSISLIPDLAKVESMQVNALLRASSDDVIAHMEARRHFPSGGKRPGIGLACEMCVLAKSHKFWRSSQAAELKAALDGGEAVLKICRDATKSDGAPLMCRLSLAKNVLDLQCLQVRLQSDLSSGEGLGGVLAVCGNIGHGIDLSLQLHSHVKPWGLRARGSTQKLQLCGRRGGVLLYHESGKAPRIRLACNVGGTWSAEVVPRESSDSWPAVQ